MRNFFFSIVHKNFFFAPFGVVQVSVDCVVVVVDFIQLVVERVLLVVSSVNCAALCVASASARHVHAFVVVIVRHNVAVLVDDDAAAADDFRLHAELLQRGSNVRRLSELRGFIIIYI